MTEQKASLNKIVAFMKEENDWVKSFDASSIGTYLPEDAMWNYKDAPHLNYIHSLAMGCQALISHNHVAALHSQKVMGLKIPMTLVEYQNGPNELIYFSTVILFTLLVNTKISQEEEKTIVNTRYYVAGPWITLPFYYILKKIILKNYKVLMSEDLPMRNRKAELRQYGYTFTHDKSDHSWLNSIKISMDNVIPVKKNIDIKIDIHKDLNNDGEYFYGTNDLYGVKLLKKENNIKIFPRICMHEGACLDKQAIYSGLIKCPWHGRSINPIVEFNIGANGYMTSNNKNYQICIKENLINISIGI